MQEMQGKCEGLSQKFVDDGPTRTDSEAKTDASDNFTKV